MSLGDLVRYFLRLGSVGFGGPIALAGYMQRDLVPRGRITAEEYAQGLAFAQTMPGPRAAQLAMWIGFLRYGVRGASLVGVVFILPAFLIVLALAFLYVRFDGLAAVPAIFYGVGPAVIAIVALSAVNQARKTGGADRRLWIMFGVVALLTFFVRTEVAILFVLAGGIGILLYASPRTWVRQIHRRRRCSGGPRSAEPRSRCPCWPPWADSSSARVPAPSAAGRRSSRFCTKGSWSRMDGSMSNRSGMLSRSALSPPARSS